MKIVLFLIVSIMVGSITINSYGETSTNDHDYAFELMRIGDFSGAIEAYTEILNVDLKDETALLNRAFAYTKIGDEDSSLKDFSTVLEYDSKNLSALKGKAAVLSEFECMTYQTCRPLEALELLETALEINPNNQNLESNRDYILSHKIKSFPVEETNGDYIINIQHVIRDKNNMLVSVNQNSRTDVLPAEILDRFLDNKENDSVNFKKEIVNIGSERYVKWHYEIERTNEEKAFFGLTKLGQMVNSKSSDGQEVMIELQLVRAIVPALIIDDGDRTFEIIQVFKKI